MAQSYRLNLSVPYIIYYYHSITLFITLYLLIFSGSVVQQWLVSHRNQYLFQLYFIQYIFNICFFFRLPLLQKIIVYI